MRPGEGILTLQRTVERIWAGNPGKEPKVRGQEGQGPQGNRQLLLQQAKDDGILGAGRSPLPRL